MCVRGTVVVGGPGVMHVATGGCNEKSECVAFGSVITGSVGSVMREARRAPFRANFVPKPSEGVVLKRSYEEKRNETRTTRKQPLQQCVECGGEQRCFVGVGDFPFLLARLGEKQGVPIGTGAAVFNVIYRHHPELPSAPA
jgi:hypothetical protein